MATLKGRMAIDIGSSLCLVSDAMSSGLVLFQDNMNVGPYVIVNIPAQQVRVYHTSEAEIAYGCTSCVRFGPRG